MRTIAEQAERDRAARRRPRRSRRNSDLLERHSETVAADGTAPWTPLDAAIVLTVLVVGIVLKQLALGSRVVEVMPASAQTGARAVVLGGFYTLQLFALIFVAYRHGLRLSQRRPEAPRALDDAPSGTLGLVVALLLATRMAALLWGVVSAAVGWGPPVRGEFTEVFGTGGGGLLLAVLMVVLAGPFVEELSFRGVVLGAQVPDGGCGRPSWCRRRCSPSRMSPHGRSCPPSSLASRWDGLPGRVVAWPAIALHTLYNGVVVGAAFWLAR